jgi:hypothetical protein
MKSKWLPLFILCSVTAMVGSVAYAGFEPLFQITEITGDCSLQRPTENKFSPAEQSKAYPFGTKIVTGENSGLLVILSEGNTCRVMANGNLSIDESKIDKKLKTIRLNNGEVEIELKENFQKGGYGLNVETATAVCGAIGCKFRVASKAEEDLRVIIIRVLEGIIRVHGENFTVTSLDKDDWLSILSPSDRSFLRLKTMKGEFDVTIKDQDLQDKNIPTKENTVLKIWQREVPETKQHIITMVLTAPNGQLVETFTITREAGKNPAYGDDNGDKDQDNPPKDEKEKPAGKRGKHGKRGNPVVKDWPPYGDLDVDPPKDLTPTPTPVGKR